MTVPLSWNTTDPPPKDGSLLAVAVEVVDYRIDYFVVAWDGETWWIEGLVQGSIASDLDGDVIVGWARLPVRLNHAVTNRAA